jgi:2-polyprenyl-3-methyl-5-hydroxy-6-metoxy-1,4-benzoquinol methylase
MTQEPDQAFWEERYRGHHRRGHERRPNRQLVAEAGDLAPGTALDAGCGEGGDAVWLASRGWRVTAVDFVGTALRRALEYAESRGDDISSRIDWVAADLGAWTPPEGHFDLVSTQYVHLPEARTTEMYRRLAASVAPGGTLLVVGHHPSDLQTTISRGSAPDLYVTAEETATGLDPDRWDIAVAEARPLPATDPDGHEITVHDAVLRARKRR